MTLERKEIFLTSGYCGDVYCPYIGSCAIKILVDKFRVTRILMEEDENNIGYFGCPMMWVGAEGKDEE